jgi:hypothetical protein
VDELLLCLVDEAIRGTVGGRSDELFRPGQVYRASDVRHHLEPESPHGRDFRVVGEVPFKGSGNVRSFGDLLAACERLVSWSDCLAARELGWRTVSGPIPEVEPVTASNVTVPILRDLVASAKRLGLSVLPSLVGMDDARAREVVAGLREWAVAMTREGPTFPRKDRSRR